MSFLVSVPIGIVILVCVAIIIVGICEIIKNKKQNQQNSIKLAMYGMILVAVATLLYRVVYELDLQTGLHNIGKWCILISGVVFFVLLFVSAGISYKRNEMTEKQKMLFRSSIPFFIMSLVCIVLIFIIRNL